MASLINTDKEALYLGTLLYDNNPLTTVAVFNNNGTNIANNATRAQAIEAMINLFKSNKAAWINAVKGSSFNMNANNYTTSPAVLQTLLDTWNQQKGTNYTLSQLKPVTGQFAGADTPWWQQAINSTGDLFGGSTTSTTTTTTPPPTSYTGVIIFVVIVVIAIVGMKALKIF